MNAKSFVRLLMTSSQGLSDFGHGGDYNGPVPDRPVVKNFGEKRQRRGRTDWPPVSKAERI